MKEKNRSKKERKGGASYTKQNQKMLEPKKSGREGERGRQGKYWSQKKLENRGMRGDQTKKFWSQKKKRNGDVRGDQTKKCWSQKNHEKKREGGSQGKYWSQKREETGRERSLDDAFVPSFNVMLSFWFGW